MLSYLIKVLKIAIMACFGISVRDRLPNIWKTITFNYVAFGWKGLLKMPIVIYCNTNIYKIGKVVLHCAMRRGLVKIGKKDYKSQGETRFYNMGTIIFEGPVKIEGATIIENFGVIVFKGHNMISDGSSVLIRSSLTFGKYSWLGFHSVIMDSDDHYTVDIASRKIRKYSQPIRIGAYNWFGNSTIIKKGVVTPDLIIVASANSVLTKDYSQLPQYSVLGGIPAKLIKTGIRCVLNNENEKKINQFFKDNLIETEYILDKEIDLDVYCSSPN